MCKSVVRVAWTALYVPKKLRKWIWESVHFHFIIEKYESANSSHAIPCFPFAAPICVKGSKSLPCNFPPIRQTTVVCKMLVTTIQDSLVNHIRKYQLRDVVNVLSYPYYLVFICCCSLLLFLSPWFYTATSTWKLIKLIIQLCGWQHLVTRWILLWRSLIWSNWGGHWLLQSMRRN